MLIVEFLFLALLLGCVLAAVSWKTDLYEKEPLSAVAGAVLLGSCSILCVQLVHKLIDLPVAGPDAHWSAVLTQSYLTAGLVEEASKFLAIFLIAARWRQFNEPFDGLLYAGLVGIGFAISENIGYMLTGAFAKVSATTMPLYWEASTSGISILLKYRLYHGHFFFDFIAGYFVARAKFGREDRDGGLRWGFLAAGLLVATFLHGTWNSIAMLSQGPWLLPLYFLFLIALAFLAGRNALRKSSFRKEALAQASPFELQKLKEFMDLPLPQKGEIFAYLLVILVAQFAIFFLDFMLASLP